MHVQDIKPRSQSMPNLNWHEMNALLDTLKRVDNESTRDLEANRDGRATISPENEKHYLRSKPHSNIPPFSIFDLEDGNPVPEAFFATALTKANTDTNKLFATFESFESNNTTYQKFTSLIGTHRPYLIAYTGAVPVVGDIVGPVPGAYNVSKLYKGLQVVSDADTVNERVWVIRHVGAGSSLIRFKLKAILPLAGKSTAIEIKTGTAYEEVGEEFPIKDPWDAPGSWREDLLVHDEDEGYRGFCIIPDNPELNEEDEPYREIVWMEQIAESINFTLTSNMSAGTATSTIDKYYLGKDPEKVFGASVSVYDPQNLYPHAVTGCKGKARYNNRENKYEIVTCNQLVLMMRCQLGSNMCPGELAVLGGHSRITWPPYGHMLDTPPSGADNPYNLAGMAGDSVLIVYNDSSSTWEVIQVTHREEEFIDGFSASSCGLGFTTHPYVVMKCRTDEGGGSIPFVEHTYLHSIRVEGCSIVAEQGTLCALGAVNIEDGDTIEFAEIDVMTGVEKVDTTGDPGYSEGQCALNATLQRICALAPEVPTVTIVPLFTAKPIIVVQNVRLNGLCLEQYEVVAYVICSEDGGWAEITCGTVCETYGSGSGI